MIKHDLTNQTAVITGGSRGIGREIARALAQAGAKAAVTGRNREKLDETVAIIEEQGGTCVAYEMEVTDHDAVKHVMGDVESRFGAVDILVNNAGIGAGGIPWEADIDEWWEVMEVNVKGVLMCSQAVLPGMVERKQGRIINIGSLAGANPSGGALPYSVSKAALFRLTDSLAEATVEHNVQVFVISPGLVYTDMTKDIPAFKDVPASQWSDIEKAGKLCTLLASGAADKLTGRFIHVEDDIDDVLKRADDIIEKDLNTLRLNRL